MADPVIPGSTFEPVKHPKWLDAIILGLAGASGQVPQFWNAISEQRAKREASHTIQEALKASNYAQRLVDTGAYDEAATVLEGLIPHLDNAGLTPTAALFKERASGIRAARERKTLLDVGEESGFGEGVPSSVVSEAGRSPSGKTATLLEDLYEKKLERYGKAPEIKPYSPGQGFVSIDPVSQKITRVPGFEGDATTKEQPTMKLSDIPALHRTRWALALRPLKLTPSQGLVALGDSQHPQHAEVLEAFYASAEEPAAPLSSTDVLGIKSLDRPPGTIPRSAYDVSEDTARALDAKRQQQQLERVLAAGEATFTANIRSGQSQVYDAETAMPVEGPISPKDIGPGRRYRALPITPATFVQNIMGSEDELKRISGVMDKVLAKQPWENLGVAVRAEVSRFGATDVNLTMFDALVEPLALALAASRNDGKPTDKDYEVARKMLPDLTKHTVAQGRALIRSALQIMENKRRVAIGLSPKLPGRDSRIKEVK